MVKFDVWLEIKQLRAGPRSQSRSQSWSRPEWVVLTGVGVGVGKFSSTPIPARSLESVTALFHYFFPSQDGNKDGNEHYVLTADSRDGLPRMVVLSLRLRLFPDELAFNHRSRLDNHNRQRHSLWGPVTWPCLINFGEVTD